MSESRFNGKTGEMLRYGLGLLVAALVAYYTTTSAIQAEIAAIKSRQDAQFGEVIRRLDVMTDDIRELRK